MKVLKPVLLLCIFVIMSCNILPHFNQSDVKSEQFSLVPDNIRVSQGTHKDKITIHWRELSDVRKYEVYRSDTDDGEYTKIGETSNNTFNDVGNTLMAETNYFYKVRALMSTGNYSDFSEIADGYRIPKVSNVASPRVSGVSPTALTKPEWSWQEIAGSYVSYRYRLIEEGEEYIDEIEWTETTEPEFIPSEDLSADVYTLYVQAKDTMGDWTQSGSHKITITDGTPFIDYITKGEHSDRIVLYWFNNERVESYLVYRGDSVDASFDIIAETKIGTFEDTNMDDLKANTNYYYKIKAIYGGENDESEFGNAVYGYRSSNLSYRIKKATVEAPSMTKSLRPTWRWNQVPDAVGYRYSFYEDYNWIVTDETKDTNSYTPGFDLTSDEWYTLFVQAKDSMGDWTSSAEKTIIVTSETPTGIEATFSEGTDRIYVTWDEMEHADRYAIYRATDPSADFERITATSSTNYMDLDLNLERLTRYYYKVHGIYSKDETSDFSQVAVGAIKYGWNHELNSMLSERGYHISETVNGKIYVIGGTDGGELGTVSIYDPTSDSWLNGETMVPARRGAAYVVINGKIYVIGGHDGATRLKRVDVYDPVADDWSSIPDMQQALSNFTAETINGKIYVFGGDTGAGDSVKVDVYDPVGLSWSYGPDMSIARSNCTSVIVGTKIYLIGNTLASGEPDRVDMFDTSNNSWTDEVFYLHEGRVNPAAEVVGNYIFIFGGSNLTEKKSVYYWVLDEGYLDLDATQMTTARDALTATVVNNIIYLIGGNSGGYSNLIETFDPVFDGYQ